MIMTTNVAEAKGVTQLKGMHIKNSRDISFNVKASWYKYGKITANQERFNQNGLTVAHKTLPFGTRLKLTNPKNNKSIIVRVNDRGPYIKGRDLDVTLGCAKRLGMLDKGVVTLQVEILKYDF